MKILIIVLALMFNTAMAESIMVMASGNVKLYRSWTPINLEPEMLKGEFVEVEVSGDVIPGEYPILTNYWQAVGIGAADTWTPPKRLGGAFIVRNTTSEPLVYIEYIDHPEPGNNTSLPVERTLPVGEEVAFNVTHNNAQTVFIRKRLIRL